MMPMPPCRAIAIANRDSVTVSMAAEANGILMVSLRVNCVEVSTSVGRIVDFPGTSSTSIKRQAFWNWTFNHGCLAIGDMARRSAGP